MTGSAELEVVAGRSAGTTLSVGDELLIGRQATGPGQIADDKLSRQHARVTVDSRGACAIVDLGSSNGTFVNGVRIAAPTALAAGDTITLGETTLVVRSLPAPAPVEAPTLARRRSKRPPAVNLDVDFTARTAELWVAGVAEPLRFVFEQGAWRICVARDDVG